MGQLIRNPRAAVQQPCSPIRSSRADVYVWSVNSADSGSDDGLLRCTHGLPMHHAKFGMPSLGCTHLANEIVIEADKGRVHDCLAQSAGGDAMPHVGDQGNRPLRENLRTRDMTTHARRDHAREM